MDKDFGRLLFADKATHCGLIRLPDVRLENRIMIMDQILLRHSDDLVSGAIITVRRNRMRISRTQ
jgi:predicted nuclease of predicted toxin-antitoxin system